jgi:hypothetical protein
MELLGEAIDNKQPGVLPVDDIKHDHIAPMVWKYPDNVGILVYEFYVNLNLHIGVRGLVGDNYIFKYAPVSHYVEKLDIVHRFVCQIHWMRQK